jgi:hypothetical protein
MMEAFALGRVAAEFADDRMQEATPELNTKYQPLVEAGILEPGQTRYTRRRLTGRGLEVAHFAKCAEIAIDELIELVKEHAS